MRPLVPSNERLAVGMWSLAELADSAKEDAKREVDASARASLSTKKRPPYRFDAPLDKALAFWRLQLTEGAVPLQANSFYNVPLHLARNAV